MSNSLISQFNVSAIDYSAHDVIKTLQNTVAKDTSPEEFAVFVGYCKATGLNPLKKEVWCIKAAGRLQIMTGINGYWQIANAHTSYDGMEGPEFEYDEKGLPISCTVKVYRKDRRFPAVGVAFLEEDSGSSPVWKQRPRVMLQKVAESRALRKAFPQELNGTYTAEEMQNDCIEHRDAASDVRTSPQEQGDPRLEALKSYANVCAQIAELNGLNPREIMLNLASSLLGRDVTESREINLEEAQRCLYFAAEKLESMHRSTMSDEDE